MRVSAALPLLAFVTRCFSGGSRSSSPWTKSAHEQGSIDTDCCAAASTLPVAVSAAVVVTAIVIHAAREQAHPTTGLDTVGTVWAVAVVAALYGAGSGREVPSAFAALDTVAVPFARAAYEVSVSADVIALAGVADGGGQSHCEPGLPRCVP